MLMAGEAIGGKSGAHDSAFSFSFAGLDGNDEVCYYIYITTTKG